MRKLLSAAAIATALAFSATPAFAHQCPAMMNTIDQKLAEGPGVAEDVLAKVRELRAEGERLHVAGRHAESVATLNEAKALLGID